MGGCISDIWDSLVMHGFVASLCFLLEELVWKAWLSYLEYVTTLFSVDCLEVVELSPG